MVVGRHLKKRKLRKQNNARKKKSKDNIIWDVTFYLWSYFHNWLSCFERIILTAPNEWMLQLSPNTPKCWPLTLLKVARINNAVYCTKAISLFFVQETATVFLLCGEINFLGLSGKQAIIGLIMCLKIKKQYVIQMCLWQCYFTWLGERIALHTTTGNFNIIFCGSYLVPVGQVEVNVSVTGQLIKHIVEA